MSFKDIKIKLHNDIPLLISILEEVGIHDIKKSRKYIQGALPNGDNPTSFCVNLMSDNLLTQIFTRSKYDGKDVIDALSFVTGRDKGDISKWLHSKMNIGYEYDKRLKTSNFLDVFTRFDRYNGNDFSNKILPSSSKDMFIPYGHQSFIDDGIDIDSQIEWDIMYDNLDNRVIIPFNNEDGELITFIGRTTLTDMPKTHPKYICYYPYNGNTLLFGLDKTKQYIKEKNEVIVVESPKSVIKLWQMGYKNAVALNKKKISDKQFEKILQLECDNVIIALDKDVEIEELESIRQRFMGLKNVYFIIDGNDYLGEKDAPVDCGEMVWEELYENRRKM